MGRGDEEAETARWAPRVQTAVPGSCSHPTRTISASAGIGPPTNPHVQKLSVTPSFRLRERPVPDPGNTGRSCTAMSIPPAMGTFPGDPRALGQHNKQSAPRRLLALLGEQGGCQEVCGVSVQTLCSLDCPVSQQHRKGEGAVYPCHHPPPATSQGPRPGLLTSGASPCPPEANGGVTSELLHGPCQVWASRLGEKPEAAGNGRMGAGRT